MRRISPIFVAVLSFGLLGQLASASDAITAARTAAVLPERHIDRVLPFDTDIYHLRFSAGAYAVVVVIGDGSTDLDLRITDRFGRVVALDFDASDDCVCRFNADAGGEYTVEVINRGSRANVYLVASN